VFLHQIVPGAADKSYGIHVAQLAGVPRAVNERAREVLTWLEAQHETNVDQSELPSVNGRVGRPASGTSNHWQMTLFGGEDHPLLDEILAVDLNSVTPLEAMRLVNSWQERLADERAGAKS
jgi:DNA mismatch repair protein MutS